jgi:hypothetical protein
VAALSEGITALDRNSGFACVVANIKLSSNTAAEAKVFNLKPKFPERRSSNFDNTMNLATRGHLVVSRSFVWKIATEILKLT